MAESISRRRLGPQRHRLSVLAVDTLKLSQPALALHFTRDWGRGRPAAEREGRSLLRLAQRSPG